MEMMAADSLFLDTNVLVYANIRETPFHDRALAALNHAHALDRKIWVNRQVLREYLTVLTRPQVFENLPRPVLLAQVGHFIERFEVADDTSDVTKQLLHLASNFDLGGKQVHDANIVATMMAYGIPALLTHNVADFKRFETIIKIEEI